MPDNRSIWHSNPSTCIYRLLVVLVTFTTCLYLRKYTLKFCFHNHLSRMTAVICCCQALLSLRLSLPGWVRFSFLVIQRNVSVSFFRWIVIQTVFHLSINHYIDYLAKILQIHQFRVVLQVGRRLQGLLSTAGGARMFASS